MRPLLAAEPRVVAADYFSWHGGGWGSKAGFELARTALGSKVETATAFRRDASPKGVVQVNDNQLNWIDLTDYFYVIGD